MEKAGVSVQWRPRSGRRGEDQCLPGRLPADIWIQGVRRTNQAPGLSSYREGSRWVPHWGRDAPVWRFARFCSVATETFPQMISFFKL